MSTYSIKDLEKASGIKAHTIRIWEKRYGIIVPERTETNIRYYSEDDLKKLLNISILNRHGYRISAIAKLTEKEVREKIIEVEQSISDPEKTTEALVIAMMDLDEEKLDKIFNRALLKHGFTDTFLNVIYPFYKKVRLLWQIGTITLAHQHFIFSILKRKIIVGIDNIDVRKDFTNKNFLLFLPEKETLDLCLLFYYYILKRKGFSVIYVGAPISLSEVHKIVEKYNPDYLLTSFMSAFALSEIEKYAKEIAHKYEDKKIFIADMRINYQKYNKPINVFRAEIFEDFRDFLNEQLSL
ncbi:MAG: helix-turn-helix-type transcriptional regulator [Bacteroidia bacterium]|nr:MAG: helix-turn-helix-type transcriptional regulator [Bacteroidia bacterium]